MDLKTNLRKGFNWYINWKFSFGLHKPSIYLLIQFFYFFKYSLGFYIFGWIISSYPYILAYIYWIRNR